MTKILLLALLTDKSPYPILRPIFPTFRPYPPGHHHPEIIPIFTDQNDRKRTTSATSATP